MPPAEQVQLIFVPWPKQLPILVFSHLTGSPSTHHPSRQFPLLFFIIANSWQSTLSTSRHSFYRLFILTIYLYIWIDIFIISFLHILLSTDELKTLQYDTQKNMPLQDTQSKRLQWYAFDGKGSRCSNSGSFPTDSTLVTYNTDLAEEAWTLSLSRG